VAKWRWRRLALVGAGLVLGAMLLLAALARVHLVRTPLGVLLVPRARAGWADAVMDVSGWTQTDYFRHPALMASLHPATRQALMVGDWSQARHGQLTLARVERWLLGAAAWLFLCTTLLTAAALAGTGKVRWAAAGAGRAGLGLVTAAVLLRAWSAGRLPYSSLYEFLLLFLWAAAGALWALEAAARRQGWRAEPAELVLAPLLAALASYGAGLPPRLQQVAPLVPVLQSNWLVLHVVTAAASYAAAAVAFAASAALLVQERLQRRGWGAGLPASAMLDGVSYGCIKAAFPLLTVVILSGAVWAKAVSGRYWSWDAKETAALVTWLVYVVYLHVRVRSGWRGRAPALLAVLGFAAVMFTFLGVSLLPGFGGSYHSYGLR